MVPIWVTVVIGAASAVVGIVLGAAIVADLRERDDPLYSLDEAAQEYE